ncbi:hypothetical protein MWU75_05035 [Ornithinimicrobium sp. F0845]|nr:hypothetical protein [Ornithinimicrobium sp. F0845]
MTTLARAPSLGRGRVRTRPPEGLGDTTAGTLATRVQALQRLAGNRAVSALIATWGGNRTPGTARVAPSQAANGHAGSIVLHGETNGTYDGGTSDVVGRRVRRAKDCDCPDETPCLRATGTLRIRYRVDVQITMPDMPGGLSECQQRRVRTFLREVLGPHEQDHRRRMRTYNGTTRYRFDLTACGTEALTQAVQEHLQAHHDEEAAARQQSAQALSDAIDPFDRPIDLDCEDTEDQP